MSGPNRDEHGDAGNEMVRGDGHLDPLEEDLSALLDEALSPSSEEALRERLRGDPALAARLVAFERVDEALRALPVPEPSPMLQIALHARIEAEHARRSARLRRRAVWTGAGFAAAASLAVYVLGPGSTGAPGDERTPEPAVVAEVIERATDEELGIVLDYDALADLDVIEELDLLERLAALDDGRRG